MQYLPYLLSIPFFYLNFKILLSDIKYKKIPNKYLIWILSLVPIYYIYIFYSFNINILFFIIWIFLSFLISFIIYSFGFWSAWDAKYLLVLALFIPHIWVINFIWNIWFITIIYLSLYFLYFYLWKCLFNYKYWKDLYKNIYFDLKQKFIIFIGKNENNFSFKKAINKIINYLIIFLLIFVSIRIFRFYFINYILETNFYNNYKDLIQNYIIFLFLFFWVIILFIYLIIKKILNIYQMKFDKKFNINIYLNSILIVILTIFIIYEYNKNPLELINYFKKLFSVYILIYLSIKILWYAYKIAFLIKEQIFINIENLKIWDIIDRDYLIKIFWNQSSLWADWNMWILTPTPKNYFLKIKNPIDNNDLEIIKECYSIVNDFHLNKAKTPWFEKIFSIKILNTFAFWPYIFFWFIFTYLFENIVFEQIKNIFFYITK